MLISYLIKVTSLNYNRILLSAKDSDGYTTFIVNTKVYYRQSPDTNKFRHNRNLHKVAHTKNSANPDTHRSH